MYPGKSLYKQDKLNTLVIRSRIPTAFTSTLLSEMVTKIKIKPEEVQPSTSGGGEQAEEQVKGVESEESYDSDEIDDEFLSNNNNNNNLFNVYIHTVKSHLQINRAQAQA